LKPLTVAAAIAHVGELGTVTYLDYRGR